MSLSERKFKLILLKILERRTLGTLYSGKISKLTLSPNVIGYSGCYKFASKYEELENGKRYSVEFNLKNNFDYFQRYKKNKILENIFEIRRFRFWLPSLTFIFLL